MKTSGFIAFSKKPSPHGFTLVELLVVIAIMAAVMSIALVGLKGIQGAGNLSEAINLVSGTLEQARSYAMANNTYVFVGISETDVTQSPTATPQTQGVGRLNIAAVASLDGTAGYSTLSGSTITWTSYNSGNGLTPLAKLLQCDNIHLAATLPTTGNMTRTAATEVVNGSSASATPFTWPLGKAQGGGEIEFNAVIQFSPQGSAQFISENTSTVPTLPSAIEIDLQPTHGNTVPSSTPNYAAIQIDGVTGAIHIYQP